MRTAPSLAALATALLLLSGCAESGPGPAPAPAPLDRISVGFPSGKVVDEIEVDAVSRLPLRSAELIAPDGKATPAGRLQVMASPGVSYSQRLGNDPYAGDVFGVPNLAPTPFAAAAAAAPQSRTTVLAMDSTAWITLPDRIAYQRDWRDYRVRLRFGDPPEVETRTLPAPAPPS